MRNEVVAAIAAKVPTKPVKWRVQGYAPTTAANKEPVVMVRQVGCKPTPNAPRAYRDVEMRVDLLMPGTDPQMIEDALDAASETLLDILDELTIPGYAGWSDAERVVYDETNQHGYRVTLTITTIKE